MLLQGRVIPCDFIGLVKSQQSVYLKVRCEPSSLTYCRLQSHRCYAQCFIWHVCCTLYTT